MLKHIKSFALLLMISGVLSGFVLAQLRVFQNPESICLCKSDFEKKGTAKKPNLTEEEKFHPKELPGDPFDLSLKLAYQSALNTDSKIPASGKFISILTPPPERV